MRLLLVLDRRWLFKGEHGVFFVPEENSLQSIWNPKVYRNLTTFFRRFSFRQLYVFTRLNASLAEPTLDCEKNVVLFSFILEKRDINFEIGFPHNAKLKKIYIFIYI